MKDLGHFDRFITGVGTIFPSPLPVSLIIPGKIRVQGQYRIACHLSSHLTLLMNKRPCHDCFQYSLSVWFIMMWYILMFIIHMILMKILFCLFFFLMHPSSRLKTESLPGWSFCILSKFWLLGILWKFRLSKFDWDESVDIKCQNRFKQPGILKWWLPAIFPLYTAQGNQCVLILQI